MTVQQNLLIILILASSLNCFGQTSKIDTTFLLKENNNGVYHAIFIDTNPASKYYDQISDFKLSADDERSYNSSLDYLKEEKIILTKKIIKGIPRKWIILKQYKGRFYAYKPCDFFSHLRIAITDTTFIDYTGEGPVASKIVEFAKIDDKTFKFGLTGMNSPNRNLLIHIIDKTNGIALFEEGDSGQEKYRYIMISAEKVRNIPIIVNFCETQKQMEFDFDEPDYSKLFKLK